MPFIKLQMARGLLSNLPASTGLPGVIVWTEDSNELYIDSGAAFQRLAAGNQVFDITDPSQLTGLAAMVGDLAVLFAGSPASYASTYMLTAFPASNPAHWTLIAQASSSEPGGQTDVAPLPGAALHEFVTFIDANGVQHLAQPTFADIAGQMNQNQMPATIDPSGSLGHIDLGTF